MRGASSIERRSSGGGDLLVGLPDDVLRMVVARLPALAVANLSQTCRGLRRVRGLYELIIFTPGEQLFNVFTRKRGPVAHGDPHNFELASKLPLFRGLRGAVALSPEETAFFRHADVAPLTQVNAAGRAMPEELCLMGHLNPRRYSLGKVAWPRARLSCILTLGDLRGIACRATQPLVLEFDSLAVALDGGTGDLACLRGRVTLRAHMLVPVDRLQLPGTQRWMASLRATLDAWLGLLEARPAQRCVVSSSNLPVRVGLTPCQLARSARRSLVVDPWLVAWDGEPATSNVGPEHLTIAIATTAARTYDCTTRWPPGFTLAAVARGLPSVRFLSFDLAPSHQAGVHRFFAVTQGAGRLAAVHVRTPALARLAAPHAATVYLTAGTECCVAPGPKHAACGERCVLRTIDAVAGQTDNFCAFRGGRLVLALARDFFVPVGWRNVSPPPDDISRVAARLEQHGLTILSEPWHAPADAARLARGDLVALVMLTTTTAVLKLHLLKN